MFSFTSDPWDIKLGFRISFESMNMFLREIKKKMANILPWHRNRNRSIPGKQCPGNPAHSSSQPSLTECRHQLTLDICDTVQSGRRRRKVFKGCQVLSFNLQNRTCNLYNDCDDEGVVNENELVNATGWETIGRPKGGLLGKMNRLLGRVFGFTFPTTFFALNHIALEDFSLKGFVQGTCAFVMKWDFVLLDAPVQGNITIGLLDMAANAAGMGGGEVDLATGRRLLTTAGGDDPAWWVTFIGSALKFVRVFMMEKMPKILSGLINLVTKYLGLEITLQLDDDYGHAWNKSALPIWPQYSTFRVDSSNWLSEMEGAFDSGTIEEDAEARMEEETKATQETLHEEAEAHTASASAEANKGTLLQVDQSAQEHRERMSTAQNVMLQKQKAAVKKLEAKRNHLLVKHFLARHHQPRSTPADEYDAEHEALSLIRLVPTDFHAACETAQTLIKKKGMARFTALTGLSKPLHCDMTAEQRMHVKNGNNVQPLSAAEYDKMATFIEQRTEPKAQEAFLQELAAARNDAEQELQEEMNTLVNAEETEAQNEVNELQQQQDALMAQTSDMENSEVPALMESLENAIEHDMEDFDTAVADMAKTGDPETDKMMADAMAADAEYHNAVRHYHLAEEDLAHNQTDPYCPGKYANNDDCLAGLKQEMEELSDKAHELNDKVKAKLGNTTIDIEAKGHSYDGSQTAELQLYGVCVQKTMQAMMGPPTGAMDHLHTGECSGLFATKKALKHLHSTHLWHLHGDKTKPYPGRHIKKKGPKYQASSQEDDDVQ
jgi:hypothetical protein